MIGESCGKNAAWLKMTAGGSAASTPGREFTRSMGEVAE